MKLPFAVYTARDGYAWQSGTEAGTGKLERLRKAIGRMPEFDFGDSPSSGMLNAGDDIVLYRFMRQEKADSHGRAALYLAMTYFTRDDARFIHADSLLSSPPFDQPLKEPPSSLDYSGPPALPFDFVVPEHNSNGIFDPTGSLAAAGFVFSQPIQGALHISRKDSSKGEGVLFRYSIPQVERQQPLPRQPEPLEQTYAVSSPTASHATKWKWVAITVGALALIEAMALFILVHERTYGEMTVIENSASSSTPIESPSPTPDMEPTPGTVLDAKAQEEPLAQPIEAPAPQDGSAEVEMESERPPAELVTHAVEFIREGKEGAGYE